MNARRAISYVLVSFISLCSAVESAAGTNSDTRCRAVDLLDLLSVNPGNLDKDTAEITGQSSERGRVEYYYDGSSLKVVRTIYYGETGKTEIEFRFRSEEDYAAELRDYYYTSPIYVEGSSIASVSISRFAVCGGGLVRGIDDGQVIDHFERTEKALRRALELAPEAK